MKKYDVKKFVFSYSATVYGDPHTCPITEDFPLSTTNPYGATKLMVEDMLRDMVKAFSEASGRDVNYKIVDRRPGDVAKCYADPKKANEELGWYAKFGLKEMCDDTWRWQSKNPNGYKEVVEA